MSNHWNNYLLYITDVLRMTLLRGEKLDVSLYLIDMLDE